MKYIISRFLNLIHKNKINWFCTIYANLMFLPFKEARKLPILIYGKCTIYNICGKIKFIGPIRYGMLRIGITDPVRSFHSQSFINIKGELHVGNNVVLRRGINLEIDKSANVIIEDDVYIGDNNTIISKNRIHIGKATRVGNNTTFMDTDFHYMVNLANNIVKKCTTDVFIGKNNWIGGNCIIKKGTKTPVGTIVAGPFTMLGKDYINLIPEYSIIGGSPAKLIAEGFRRINNCQTEIQLSKHFSDSNNTTYMFSSSVDLNKVCLPN